MQSESGIVPDFEVGEEFHEEAKTFYELKSQPLSRSLIGKIIAASYNGKQKWIICLRDLLNLSDCAHEISEKNICAHSDLFLKSQLRQLVQNYPGNEVVSTGVSEPSIKTIVNQAKENVWQYYRNIDKYP